MKKSALTLVAAIVLAALSGCVTPQVAAPWPRPPVLTHMDIDMKKAYIVDTRKTLQTMRLSAGDYSRRENFSGLEAFHGEVDKFVGTYVRPIINDPEVLENLETRFETAKLHLLTALVYYDTTQYEKAEAYLKTMDERYGDDNSVLSAAANYRDIGYRSISEGVGDLKKKISSR